MCTHITVIGITSYQPECKIDTDLTLALTFNTIINTIDIQDGL